MTDTQPPAVSRARLVMSLLAATALCALVAAAGAIVWQANWAGWLSLLVALLAGLALVQQRRALEAAKTMAAEMVALRKNRATAETASFSRAHFIADMGHDLRQPLHALGLFLDALERRVVPGEGEKILAQTREAASTLGRAFNALIDLVRVEADALVPELERVPVDDFLVRLVEEAAEAVPSGVDIRVVHARSEAVSDARIIAYIARILLANMIDLGPSRILIGTRRRADKLHLELHCARPGDVARKWESLKASRAPANIKGLELDLFVARRLADLLGIDLGVKAKAGHGVVITLVIPVAAEDDAMPLRGRSILVVTDQVAAANAREVALARAGAIVHVAGNARQAAYAARISKVDLLVTELPMGDVAVRGHIERGTRMLADRAPVESLVAAACAALEPRT